MPTYQAAKASLEKCSTIDEWRLWADKSAALASYARQSQDDTLLKMAVRIQARAIKRCGELLKTYDGRGRNNHPEGVISQAGAAKKAGLSRKKKERAVQVANVPDEEFEELVESEKPPSVTKLAELGKKKRMEFLDKLAG